MVKASEFSVGLMQKMALAFAKAGFKPEELNQLCENPQKVIRTVDVFRGYGHVTKRQWKFQNYAYPAGWRIKEVIRHPHKSNELLDLEILSHVCMELDRGCCIFTRHADGLYANGVRLELYEATPARRASTHQRNAWYDYAHVYEELKSVSNSGFELAHFLLRYPHLIPEEWFPEEQYADRHIIFPGTVVSNFTKQYPYGGPNVFALTLYRDQQGKTAMRLNLVVTTGCYGEGLSRPSALILK